MDLEKPILLVAFADTHPNSRSGLCPPKFVRPSDGGIYQPNRPQKWLWKCWLDFWNVWVRGLADAAGAETWAICAGDGADDNTHDRYGLISLSPADIVELSCQAHRPAREAAAHLFWVRGTPAHAGEGGGLEELVARRMEAEQDPQTGARSRWQWRMEVAGVKIDCRHHAATYSWTPWTRGADANRQAAREEHAYRDNWRDRPDVSLFGHGHYFSDSGGTHDIRAIYLPSWQCATLYAVRKGSPPELAEVGGVALLCRGGKYELHVKRYELPPERRWRVEKEKEGGSGGAAPGT